MKRKLLLLLIQGVVFSTKAQDQHTIYYGMEAGFTVSFFDQPNAPFEDPTLVEEFDKAVRTSFELGATADYIVTDLLSFSSGLMYSERGGSYRTKNPNRLCGLLFSGVCYRDRSKVPLYGEPDPQGNVRKTIT